MIRENKYLIEMIFNDIKTKLLIKIVIMMMKKMKKR